MCNGVQVDAARDMQIKTAYHACWKESVANNRLDRHSPVLVLIRTLAVLLPCPLRLTHCPEVASQEFNTNAA